MQDEVGISIADSVSESYAHSVSDRKISITEDDHDSVDELLLALALTSDDEDDDATNRGGTPEAPTGFQHLFDVTAGLRMPNLIKLLLTLNNSKESSVDIDVNAGITRKRPGFSSLHAAASFGDTRTLRLLLDHGAQVVVITPEHATPAHYAAKCDASALRMLLVSAAA